MNLPKVQYRVVVIPGGPALSSRQKGGGVFSTRAGAKGRLDSLRRAGVRCSMYMTECDWHCIDEQPVEHVPGQEPLF
jgi:hypothetical protein